MDKYEGESYTGWEKLRKNMKGEICQQEKIKISLVRLVIWK